MLDDNNKVLSFAISLLFWWMLLGSLPMAFLFLIMLFVHEMGHVIAARHKGIEVTMPTFTPFGAFIQMIGRPHRADDEAYIGYGGPFLGTIAGIAALALGITLGVPELIRVAYIAFWLNLFNLIPVSPLDGGRISMAIDRRLWVLGAPLLLWMLWQSVLTGNIFNLFILAMITMSAVADIKQRDEEAQMNPRYFDVPLATRALWTVLYFGLGAFLIYAITNISTLVRFFSHIF